MILELNLAVNFLAVIVSAIAGGMILGTFWYGPLFGKQWMKLVGLNEKDKEKAMKEGMAKYYLASIISSIIFSLILAVLILNLGATTLAQGICVGFLVWIGFIMTTMLNSVLWERKSVKLYIINISYQLVSIILMSIILVLWK